jgi:hypothetical protein
MSYFDPNLGLPERIGEVIGQIVVAVVIGEVLYVMVARLF